MASGVPAEAVREITEAVGAMQSATKLIETFEAMLQKARDESIANGATAEQLQPVSDVLVTLDTEGNRLAAAVAAHPQA